MGLEEIVSNSFNWFFSTVGSNTFSLESYLFLHFSILGIIVTLIALTTTLTKEVRQDLIWNYYLKTKLIIFYISFIVFSFLLTLSIYLFSPSNLSFVIFVLSIVIFLYTIIFIICFMRRLKREWLYKQIIREFKNEIKK
jgi:uncharacterized membrane protein